MVGIHFSWSLFQRSENGRVRVRVRILMIRVRLWLGLGFDCINGWDSFFMEFIPKK